MKCCTSCGQHKHLREFKTDRRRLSGHASICLTCDTARHRAAYAADPERGRQNSRSYYELNREKINQRRAEIRKANPSAVAEASRREYLANREQYLSRTRARKQELRTAVLARYGTACACCRSTEQLGIDHIDGDGREHREELFGRQEAGALFWLWLVNQGLPAGYQTLCRPCNTSKGSGVQCRLQHERSA